MPTPVKIFISHRAEYANLVRELKSAITATSRGTVKAVISEELPPGEEWRPAIKAHLKDSAVLFLIYGAAYEDWSWCFYEAGYFAGLDAAKAEPRPIYCIAREEVDAPGPLNDLQMLTDKEQLINILIKIYDQNHVDYDGGELRERVTRTARGLFEKLAEFVSYPRVYFVAKNSDFAASAADLPDSALLKGESSDLQRLFAIGKKAIPWAEITKAGNSLASQERFFFRKWADEMRTVILAARESKFIPAQTVLVRGTVRVRFLLYVARAQADGSYVCEFLVIDEVGGPPVGVPQVQLALLTSVRLGFRFRYEFVKRFGSDPAELSEEERRTWIREIPQIIDHMMVESERRGNITAEDLENAFDEEEEGSERVGTILGYWPLLKENLYDALGLSPDGTPVSDQGLLGTNVEKYRLAFKALELINIEFLSRCCARLAHKRLRHDDDLRSNAKVIEQHVRALKRMKTALAATTAAPVAVARSASSGDDQGAVVAPPGRDPVSAESRPHV